MIKSQRSNIERYKAINNERLRKWKQIKLYNKVKKLIKIYESLLLVD